MSKHAKAAIYQKSMYLTAALNFALEKYPCMEGIHWEECCQQAVAALADIPMCVEAVKNLRMVQSWFSEFRMNKRKFILLPILYKYKYKHKHNNIPEFLQVYPDLKEAIIEFCDNSIDTCSENKSEGSSDKSNGVNEGTEKIIVCDAESLCQNFQEAAEHVTYQQVMTRKEKKKKEHKLILKGLLAVPLNNGSSRVDDICSEGTIE
eukprot:8092687-Ditylum_brightwellii.AAC.1